MDGWSLLKLSPNKQEHYLQLLETCLPEVESYYPRYTCMIRPHGVRRAREVVRPVYPGYVFLKIGGWDMRGPVSLPIMAQWVRFGGKVEVVSCRVVEGLRTLEGAGELVKEIKYVNPYHTGVAVRVHLPVCDLAGIIVKLVKNRAFVDTHLCRVMVPIHTLEVV